MRLYEQWGVLPKARRSPGGYRRFSEYHLDQLHLIRLISVVAGRGALSGNQVIPSSSTPQQALDTPRPDEDVWMGNDHWLSALEGFQKQAFQVVGLLEEMLAKHYDPPVERER